MTRKTTFRLAIAALGVAIVTAACSGETETGDPVFTPDEPAGSKLESALQDIIVDTGVPSLGAAAFNSDGVLDLAAAGVRQYGHEVTVTADDSYHLGSNTKAMTAALVGRLSQHNGGISFDTTVGQAFGNTVAVDPAYADVTLADLLSHTGGTPDETPSIDEDTFFNLSLPEQRAVAARLVLAEQPAFAPRTESHYSNVGYVIVGAALESLAGRSWEDLIQAEIFGPLNMDSCGFGAPAGGAGDAAPAGHAPDMTPVYEDTNPPVFGPAGTVNCSVADWGLFLSELLNGYRGESTLFDQATVTRLLTPAAIGPDESGFAPALGWSVAEGPDGAVYMHDGSNGAWFSQAVLVPDRNVAVVGVSNHEETGMAAVGAVLATLSEMYPGEAR